MNIAHVLPYSATFPLKKHNGRYEWVLRLATLQQQQGHTVSIYSSPRSHGDQAINWCSAPGDPKDKERNNTSLFRAALKDPQHDIFHSHFDFLHYKVAHLTNKPIVYTQHWFPTEAVIQANQACDSKNVLAVPPTNYLRSLDKKLGIPAAETIYHGIDLRKFKFSNKPRSERFIFVGRIAPHKGVLEAVTIARSAGIALDIVGKVNSSDEAYWQKITPFVDGKQIAYLGPRSQTEVANLLANAKAFLFPSQIIEAFGQVTIEAQACGTPVIIQNIGPSNELVKDGITGFVVKTDSEYLNAIKNVSAIMPESCREFAETFSIGKMLEGYNELYQDLLYRS